MNKLSLKKSFTLLIVALFLVGGFFVANAFAIAILPVTTDPATSITSTDATLNGTNGNTAAENSSFWVSTNPVFDVSTPSIPAGVYSTPVLGAVGVGASFSAPLSIVTTNGIITGGVSGNMPAITPNTTYYFVAWSDVGGTWSHGEILSFSSASVPDTTPPTTPVHLSPADNSTLTTAALTEIDWTDSTDADSAPVTYVYQAANDPTTNPDGSFVTPVYTSGVLTESKIPTLGTPAGVYYWHVKVTDSAAVPNSSPWTSAWKVTVDNNPPACNEVSSFDGFINGSVNGQGGWQVTGPFDQAVVDNTYGYPTFGCKSLRISDSVTSGSFGDQIFAKPEVNGAGEVDSTSADFSVGTLQNHFESQFDIASTKLVYQPGMHLSISPDRGDGSRMSYLRLEDSADGINVFFDDVQGTTNPANFVETQIATALPRTTPHTFKFVMDFIDGPSNDVVKVYIDGSLVHTGTSWENYYRYDSEASTEQSPRIVKTVLFRESGTATPADAGNGFLIDNYSTSSSIVSPNPTTLAATPISLLDSTLNGTNGPFDATGHSFWVSTDPFVTTSPIIPAGVYSTPDFGAISASASFSATLSSLTTTGIPTNLPAITEGTTYYFVAWALVNGTWYPGEMLHFNTGVAEQTPSGPQGSGPLVETPPPTQTPPPANDQTLPAGGNGNDNSGNGQVLGAQTFQFTRTLRLGMKGDDVLELHKKLTELGLYKGPIDNSFGLLLQAAVKAFQKANPPLKVDGIVGPKTREVLNK